VEVPRQTGPTAWTAETLTDADQWSFDLRRFCTDEGLRGHEPPSDGVILHEGVTTSDLPEGFDEVAAEVRRRLFDGPGFVIVRGFPVSDGGRRRATQLYASLMARFGAFIAQNTAGDHLHLVRTKGFGADLQYGSRGSGELLFHTDQAAAPPAMLPAVLGLLTLERAATGGLTQLMSGHTLLNALLDIDADHATALVPPAPFGREDSGVSDAGAVVAPILVVEDAGRARLRYNRFFTEAGAKQTGRALAPALVAAFDAADTVLDRPELPLQLLLEVGDALIADNSLVLHNRSAYEDDGVHQRCLVRAWVN
jgi:hypothetical protein